MKASSAVKHQLNLPPAQLSNVSPDSEPRRKTSPAVQATAVVSEALVARRNTSPDLEPRTNPSEACADAARLLDEALEAARLSNKDVAALLGVSESLVNRWRSPNYTEAPSFIHLLRLPPTFHWQLHKAMNRRYGFARRAAMDLIEAAGLVALAVER